MVFTVHFTVSTSDPLKENEYMFVTGNAEQLGEWDPKKALKLSQNADRHWSGTVSVSIETVKFRYFTGYYLAAGDDSDPVLIISQWETHLTPRFVMPAVEATKTRVCRANVNDVFGFNGGREVMSNGWLEHHNQIILRLHGKAVKFYKPKHEKANYRIRISPTDLRHREDGDDEDEEDEEEHFEKPSLPSFSRAQIAALTKANPRFRDQSPNGEVFTNEVDYYLYRTQSVAVEFLGFRIEILNEEGTDVMATGYALPSTLANSCGNTSVPLLTKKGLPIGKLYFGYLFVRPIALPIPEQKMKASYTKHWKKRSALEVGHRGMGNSYTKFAAARENTLHSLNSAAKNGADYVEFDVHLTKDKVPIIFHDFHVLVSVAKRIPSIQELNLANETINGSVDAHELAVKDLTLSQLRLLHLDHVQHKNSLDDTTHKHTVTAKHDEEEEHRPFPTLNDSFHGVSEEVGFNIEVKYPMGYLQGGHECENYFEPNECLDIILADVLNNAGTRRIMFSSFDPDICLMLALKQNKYPVLFLNQGQTQKHPAYQDPRTQTSSMAVKFVAGAGLVGVNFNSEDILRDPEPVQLAKQFGLITFVWGDELADKKVVEYFKKTLGVDGVIYDRIGEAESRSNVFLLERAMKQALFEKRPVSPGHSPKQSHKFRSNGQMNMERIIPTTTAAIEHLDLPIATTTKIAWPGMETAASVNSSTSSGFSTDGSTITNQLGHVVNQLKRQPNSFSHGFQPVLTSQDT
uniref:Glycerophosphocholine phosphodiesterase GPCPD1 n=2 Tax=Bursaphelenchus xylophilus TaxID=6326 RepID=A0A1I7RPJ2_BURXY